MKSPVSVRRLLLFFFGLLYLFCPQRTGFINFVFVKSMKNDIFFGHSYRNLISNVYVISWKKIGREGERRN